MRFFGWLGATLVSLGLFAAPARPAAQTIDTIIIVNRNIFDPVQAEELGFVAKAMNAVHLRTRASVIRRTLLLEQGEEFDSALVAESERALRALRVFRHVVVDTARLDDRFALLAVTSDGWSTKPRASFTTAGGDATWEFGLIEENFLGLASTLVAVFRHTPDRQETVLRYRSPHFLFRRTTLLAQYVDRSDGRRAVWRYGVPFYRASANWALLTEGDAADERVLVFRDGALDTALTRRHLRFGMTVGRALRATSRDYVRVWLSGHWRREDIGARGAALPRSVFGAAGVGMEAAHVRFRVLHQFNSYARREDVNLSQVLRLGLWAAPAPWGYPDAQAGIGPEFYGQVSAVWRTGFAALRASGHGTLTGAGLDSGRVRASFTVADQRLPRQTWIAHVDGGAIRRPRPGTEFDLWRDEVGPRLFGAHAFTGTRMLWGTIENRLLLIPDLVGIVGIGIAPFVDLGGAWYADQDPRVGGNVGIALRLGPNHAVRGDAHEIAFGYRFGEGQNGRWAIAVRRGTVF